MVQLRNKILLGIWIISLDPFPPKRHSLMNDGNLTPQEECLDTIGSIVWGQFDRHTFDLPFREPDHRSDFKTAKTFPMLSQSTVMFRDHRFTASRVHFHASQSPKKSIKAIKIFRSCLLNGLRWLFSVEDTSFTPFYWDEWADLLSLKHS